MAKENNLVYLNVDDVEYKVGLTNDEIEKITNVTSEEESRVKAETKRDSDETGRKDAEILREAAEHTYNDSNVLIGGREFNENERIENENKRIANEGETGVLKINDDNTYEITTEGSGRLYKEQLREANESLRIKNESKRASNFNDFMNSIKISSEICDDKGNSETAENHGTLNSVHIITKWTDILSNTDKSFKSEPCTFTPNVGSIQASVDREVGKIYNASGDLVPLYCYYYAPALENSIFLPYSDENRNTITGFIKNTEYTSYSNYYKESSITVNSNGYPFAAADETAKTEQIDEILLATISRQKNGDKTKERSSPDGVWDFTSSPAKSTTAVTNATIKANYEGNIIASSKAVATFANGGLYGCYKVSKSTGSFTDTISNVGQVIRVDAFFHKYAVSDGGTTFSIADALNYKNYTMSNCSYSITYGNNVNTAAITLPSQTLPSSNYWNFGYFTYALYYIK